MQLIRWQIRPGGKPVHTKINLLRVTGKTLPAAGRAPVACPEFSRPLVAWRSSDWPAAGFLAHAQPT